MRDHFRKCEACGSYHWLSEWPANHVGREVNRSHFPAPMLIRDDMPPTVSMADGKEYTSKSAMRATYLPSGNPKGERFIEVGNERVAPRKPPTPDTKSIDAAIGKAMSIHGLGA